MIDFLLFSKASEAFKNVEAVGLMGVSWPCKKTDNEDIMFEGNMPYKTVKYWLTQRCTEYTLCIAKISSISLTCFSSGLEERSFGAADMGGDNCEMIKGYEISQSIAFKRMDSNWSRCGTDFVATIGSKIVKMVMAVKNKDTSVSIYIICMKWR